MVEKAEDAVRCALAKRSTYAAKWSPNRPQDTFAMPKTEGEIVRLYHRTAKANAVLILRDGFLDREERYTSDFDTRGVWFSDQTRQEMDLGSGGSVMSIDLAMAQQDLAAFEWTEDETPYREWLIPARLVNATIRGRAICKARSLPLGLRRSAFAPD